MNPYSNSKAHTSRDEEETKHFGKAQSSRQTGKEISFYNQKQENLFLESGCESKFSDLEALFLKSQEDNNESIDLP